MPSELYNKVVDRTKQRGQRTVRDLVVLQSAAIERQLAGAMSSEAFVRTALTEFSKNPQLENAAAETVLGSLMLAAQLRLEIGSALGEFYLTTRREHVGKPDERTICVPIIGYPGLIKLVVRSGFATKVETVIVRDGDQLTIGANSERGRFYEWTPADYDDDRPWVGVIASAELSAGSTAWVHMTKQAILQRRPTNGWERTPWKTHEEAMAQKTAIRAMVKYLPKSVEMGKALQADGQHVSGAVGEDRITITPLDDTQDGTTTDEGERE